MKIFKPKELNDSEWAFCKKLTKENIDELMLAAEEMNSVPALAYLMSAKGCNYFYRTAGEIAAKAITKGNMEMLEKVFEIPKGTQTNFFAHGNIPSIFEAAANAASVEGWDFMLRKNNRIVAHCVDADALLNIALKARFAHGIQSVLRDSVSGATKVLSSKETTQDQFSLLHALMLKKMSPEDKCFAKALAENAAHGNIDRVKALLDGGASINHNNCAALQNAVMAKNKEMVSFLVDQGASVELYGRKILQDLKTHGADRGFMSWFEEIVEKETPLRVVATARQIDDRYCLCAPDTLAETQKLPNGGILTILFNFTTQQQMVLAHNQPPVIVPFDNLPDAAIDIAYDTLVSLEGTAEKPDRIKKTLQKPVLAGKGA